jgi:hypothetical protein
MRKLQRMSLSLAFLQSNGTKPDDEDVDDICGGFAKCRPGQLIMSPSTFMVARGIPCTWPSPSCEHSLCTTLNHTHSPLSGLSTTSDLLTHTFSVASRIFPGLCFIPAVPQSKLQLLTRGVNVTRTGLWGLKLAS